MIHLLKHCFEKFSNRYNFIAHFTEHRPASCRGRSNGLSLPTKTHATNSKWSKNCATVRSRDSVAARLVILPKLDLKNCNMSCSVIIWFPLWAIITWRINSCVDCENIASAWTTSHKTIVIKQLLLVSWWTVTLRRQNDMREWQLAVVGDVELLLRKKRLVYVLRLPKIALSLEISHVVKKMLHWHEDTCCRNHWSANTCCRNQSTCHPSFFTDCMQNDASTKMKPNSWMAIFVTDAMHFVRILSTLLYCSIFSDLRIGDSFKYWWRHVTMSQSQTTHRHLQLVPVPDRTVCPFLGNEIASLARSCSGYLLVIIMVLGLIPAFLGVMKDFSGFMFSSWKSKLTFRRKNARAS